MQIVVSPPEKLNATVVLPASKSISNRALVIRALTGGGQPIENVAECDDCRVVVEALAGMGPVVEVGAAGTAMRFLTALLAQTEGEWVIRGTERMHRRPIGVLVDALRQLGAEVDYAGEVGFPPLRIRGRRLEGGCLELPGDVSSQYVSALLMIGPTLCEGLELRLRGEVMSRPYIDMTLGLMRHYGAVADWVDERVIRVEGSGYRAAPYYIENDWSAASYWYEMVALSGDKDARVVLPGLFAESLQGDSAVARMFEKLGVSTGFTEEGVVLGKMECDAGERFEWDMTGQPDLAQTVAVTCCMLGKRFALGGLRTLRIKETDRLAALQAELGKLGFVLRSVGDDLLCWDGEMVEVAATEMAVDTYEDHRMAMAFAPVAMLRGRVRINDPGVVSKSYPGFWTDLQNAGFKTEKL